MQSVLLLREANSRGQERSENCMKSNVEPSLPLAMDKKPFGHGKMHCAHVLKDECMCPTSHLLLVELNFNRFMNLFEK